MLVGWGGGAIAARRTVMTVLSMLAFTLMAVSLIPTPTAHIMGLI